MSGADELFSTEVARPVTDRLKKATWILGIAAPLNLMGVFCFTGVPGAMLSIWGWNIAEEELHRVEVGALPAEREHRARWVRAFGFAQIGIATVSLLVQLVLFGIGFYDGLVVLILTLVGLVTG